MPSLATNMLRVATPLSEKKTTKTEIEEQEKKQVELVNSQEAYKYAKESMDKFYMGWMCDDDNIHKHHLDIIAHPAVLKVYEYYPGDIGHYCDLYQVQTEEYKVPKPEELDSYIAELMMQPLLFVEVVSIPGNSKNPWDMRAKLLCVAGRDYIVVFDVDTLEASRAMDMFNNQLQVVVMQHALPSLVLLKAAGIFMLHPPIDLSFLTPFNETDSKLYEDSWKEYYFLSKYYEDIQEANDYSVIMPTWDEEGFPQEKNNLGQALYDRFHNIAYTWETIKEKIEEDPGIKTLLKSSWIKCMTPTVYPYVAHGLTPVTPMEDNINDLNEFQKRFFTTCCCHRLVAGVFDQDEQFYKHRDQLFKFAMDMNDGLDLESIKIFHEQHIEELDVLQHYKPEDIQAIMKSPMAELRNAFEKYF